MKLSYIKMYWATLKGTAMWNQRVQVVTYHENRIFWRGTVGQFVEEKEPHSYINDDSWIVVSFGHPAVTKDDEAIPVYNRDIEIQVI